MSAVDYHHTGFGWLAGGRAVLSLVTSGQIIVSSRQNRPLNCLAFSPCGGYIALGEGGCTDPEVQLFDISSGEILWWTTVS